MIRIGTAGWSYPTGEGRWTGIFYPTDRKIEPLEFYAHFFVTVEVNSTFYRPLAPGVARNWAGKTPRDFRFAIKLYQKFTHPKMFEDATGAEAGVANEDFARFLESVAPLAEAGKLGPILAQFPPSYKRSEETLAYLDRLASRLHDHQLVVELRHESWTDDDAAAKLLAKHGVSWARIDEPKFASSIGQVPTTGPVGYFRFHGRNYKEWWHGDRETRYNYLYSPAEQGQLAQQITAVAGTAGDTHVVYNNHYRAKAVANALQMKLLLGQDVPDDIPAPLLTEYSDLAKLLEHEAAERAS
jgi:uncharacterized protein YecE (DUF72 family)